MGYHRRAVSGIVNGRGFPARPVVLVGVGIDASGIVIDERFIV